MFMHVIQWHSAGKSMSIYGSVYDVTIQMHLSTNNLKKSIKTYYSIHGNVNKSRNSVLHAISRVIQWTLKSDKVPLVHTM